MPEPVTIDALPETPPANSTIADPVTATRSDVPDIPGYDIDELIGRGGMGRVYKARHRGLNRVVAIKLLIGTGDDPQMVTRFEQEAKAVASLHHPNIAQIFDTGTANGSPYYAMEYIAGGSLAEALAGKPLPPPEAARIVEAIARGMQHAHENGIIHRDLKPGNILLPNADRVRTGEPNAGTKKDNETAHGSGSESRLPTFELEVKVADFGLAKRFADEAKITRTGEILGTPSYMAPEQASGIVTGIGPPADVYALGAILYECLTGRPPFAGPDAVQTVLQVLSMEPVPPRQLQPRLPADLNTICLKCLEKSPRKRYASAGELAEDLRRFLDNRPIIARPVRPWERAWKWSRRKPWQAAAVALAGFMLIGAGVGVYLLQGAYRETKSANGLLTQSNIDLAAQKKETDSANELLKKANDDLIAQKREADMVIKLALEDLDKFTYDVVKKLGDMPNTETIQRDLLDDARKSLAELDKLRPKDYAVREYSMVGYDKLAVAENRLGRYPAALESERRALQLADELVAEHPEEKAFQIKQARYHSLISLLSARLGQAEESAKHLKISHEMSQRLLKDDPDNEELLKLSTLSIAKEYQDALAAKDDKRAEAGIRQYVAVYEHLAKLAPANLDRALDLAQAQMLLVGFFTSHRRPKEAAPLLENIQKNLGARTEPSSMRFRKMKASLEWTRGDVLAALNQNPEAETAYLAAAKEYESLLTDYPKTRDLRLTLAQVYWNLGQLWYFTMQPAKARPHLLKAKAILEQFAADKLEDDQSKTILGYVEQMLAPPVKK